MNKFSPGLVAFGVVFVIGALSFILNPIFRGAENVQKFAVNKVDEYTNYDTIKEVEDKCRSMIASYESDKLTYKQYKDSDSEEKQSWAEQAKMRANKTASAYNNYVLENSFVWKHNIPDDIKSELHYIQ